jgi:hypothetical protein
MPSAQRFAALESLRPGAIDSTRSRRTLYLGKPVPLGPLESQAWEDSVALWQSMYLAYALCSDAGMSAEAAATVSQRSLDALGRAIREHVHACRAVPATVWKEFHTCYRSASDCALADVEVSDPLQPQERGSCQRSYLAAVLYECANPYLLCAEQVNVLAQWLPHWLDLVGISAAEPLWASRSPLALDLGAGNGARLARDIGSGDGVRYLDTSALGMRLRELADCLRKSQPAVELEAAAGVAPAVLSALLTHLYVQWCSAGSANGDERPANAVRAQVALGMHAIHFQISGRAFRQPGLRYTREEEHDLATFGHITERTEQRLLTGRSAALEPWELVARTGSSLALRRKPDITARIAHGQLAAVRTSSIDAPSLVLVQRIRIEADGEMSVGVRVIRGGEVRGAAIRAAGSAAQKYERALIVEADRHAGLAHRRIRVSRPRGAHGTAYESHRNRPHRRAGRARFRLRSHGVRAGLIGVRLPLCRN